MLLERAALDQDSRNRWNALQAAVGIGSERAQVTGRRVSVRGTAATGPVVAARYPRTVASSSVGAACWKGTPPLCVMPRSGAGGARHSRRPGSARRNGTLWGRPDVRKRWILRARNEDSVREIADALAWNVASSLDRVLPTHLLGHTVENAVLHDFAEAIDLNHEVQARPKKSAKAKDWLHLWVSRPVAGMLAWFIRHHPESAHYYIGEITRESHTRWDIPAKDTLSTLRQYVITEGNLSVEDAESFFALLTPPEKND